jgi:hypothetical protein
VCANVSSTVNPARSAGTGTSVGAVGFEPELEPAVHVPYREGHPWVVEFEQDVEFR